MSFTFTPVYGLPDVVVIEGHRFEDERDLNISDKDANAPLLKDAENNFYY